MTDYITDIDKYGVSIQDGQNFIYFGANGHLWFVEQISRPPDYQVINHSGRCSCMWAYDHNRLIAEADVLRPDMLIAVNLWRKRDAAYTDLSLHDFLKALYA